MEKGAQRLKEFVAAKEVTRMLLAGVQSRKTNSHARAHSAACVVAHRRTPCALSAQEGVAMVGKSDPTCHLSVHMRTDATAMECERTGYDPDDDDDDYGYGETGGDDDDAEEDEDDDDQ